MAEFGTDPVLSAGESRVVITDIRMPFLSMVVFILKWVLASIPAMIIMFVLFAILSLVLGGVVAAFSGGMSPAG